MTPPRRPVGRPPYNPRKACAAMRGVGNAAPYKVRREHSAARGLTASPFFGLHRRAGFSPRRGGLWAGRPTTYRAVRAAMRGVGDAAPYKVRRAVGGGHARPAASRNRPFTVDPQGRDSSLPHRVPLPPKQKPRKAPRPARSFCILKNVTPFSRRSAFSARPESRPAAPPAWGRRGQQAPPPRAPHACPSPSACSWP